MVWIIGVLCGLCLFLALRLYLMRWETKRLAERLKELAERARYGARLYLEESDKVLGEIAASLNRVIDGYEERLWRADDMENGVRLSVSGISHDLRTPLTSLRGYVQLLGKTDSPEKREEYMEIIESSARVLSDLIENFYDLSRLEMGDDIFSLRPVNLERAVCERFLGFYENFLKKGIEVTIHDAETAPIVSADPLALDRVLNNLIQNLLRYAKAEAEISFSEENGYCLLTVSNSTDSALPEETGRIFERFYTAGPVRGGKSAGLGLYVTRKLVEGMGGAITACGAGGRVVFIIKLMKDSRACSTQRRAVNI
ncbi:MAG: HAMP domain-containing histidine kinase [Clostridiales bacterium]|jgi:signal transduction histidine kinase|nr:HAMP domain-containing histidine kinase [Clostridiales bacterium]